MNHIHSAIESVECATTAGMILLIVGGTVLDIDGAHMDCVVQCANA